MPPGQTLLRRAIPEVDTEAIRRETSRPDSSVTDENATIHDLLERAQELHGYRAPINERINLIKNTLANRVNPRYNDENQLTMFDNCANYAIRDPEDNERIIVAHPTVGIKFRHKRVRTVKYKEIRRSISDEIARRRALVENQEQLPGWQRTQEDMESERTHQNYIQALEWVQNLFETRVGYRNDNDFIGGTSNAEEA